MYGIELGVNSLGVAASGGVCGGKQEISNIGFIMLVMFICGTVIKSNQR